MRDLNELKRAMLEYCERHASKGGNVKTWQCPSCKVDNKTLAPTEEGDVWDSATTCYECGETSFATKTYDTVTAQLIPVKKE